MNIKAVGIWQWVVWVCKKICTNSYSPRQATRTRENAGFRNPAPALFLAASLPCPLDWFPLLHTTYIVASSISL